MMGSSGTSEGKRDIHKIINFPGRYAKTTGYNLLPTAGMTETRFAGKGESMIGGINEFTNQI